MHYIFFILASTLSSSLVAALASNLYHLIIISITSQNPPRQPLHSSPLPNIKPSLIS
jgi:hypothetical protein